jgi:hypothetical protein
MKSRCTYTCGCGQVVRHDQAKLPGPAPRAACPAAPRRGAFPGTSRGTAPARATAALRRRAAARRVGRQLPGHQRVCGALVQRQVGAGLAASTTSIMVWWPRSSSSMKPCGSSQASTRGTCRPASAISWATLTKGRQSSLSGGASMMMRLPVPRVNAQVAPETCVRRRRAQVAGCSWCAPAMLSSQRWKAASRAGSGQVTTRVEDKAGVEGGLMDNPFYKCSPAARLVPVPVPALP